MEQWGEEQDLSMKEIKVFIKKIKKRLVQFEKKITEDKVTIEIFNQPIKGLGKKNVNKANVWWVLERTKRTAFR